MAYQKIIQAKIGYALAVTIFTEKELKKIQRVVDTAYRPKTGLNRHFPNRVVQGPSKYYGLAQPPFYITQGYKQLQLLIGTIRNQGDTGKLARASLEFEQQESSYITLILSNITPTTYQEWTPKTWVGSIKEFFLQCKQVSTSMTNGVH